VAETRRLITEALTYPAIVLLLAFGLLCTVIMVVVPQFAEGIKDFGISLPGMTVAMMALADSMPEFLTGLGIAAVGIAILLIILRSTPHGRLVREHIMLAIPVFGPLIRNSLRARFLRAMAFAVDSGIPLPEAMRLSAGATASPLLSQEADRVASQVEGGRAIYEACQGARLIPEMFGYVVETGSNGGNLRDALVQLSKAYESHAAHSQSLLRGWLTPVAVVGVGMVIGMLILALFLPLVQLVQSVSG